MIRGLGLLRLGSAGPDPMDHNPADDPAPCEWPGCDLMGENIVDGLPYCDKHVEDAEKVMEGER